MNLLRNLDFFGVLMTFYVGEKQRYYNKLGGIITLITIISCIILFIVISLDDFKKENPIISTSEFSTTEYKSIKLGKEKIWIPFRIATYEEKFVEHKKILYPIIYYYSGQWIEGKGMELSYRKLSYRLCNETAMAKNKANFFIEVPLDEIYCIDMDDLNIGGSWISEYINYIQFDLYLCEGGGNFDENSTNCTSFEKIKQLSEGTSWLFEFFYPVIQFEFRDNKNPVKIIYRSKFYNLSKFNLKIERIYLKENIISDHNNLFWGGYSNSSYWSLGHLDSDSYYNDITSADLIREGSTSRIYSFKIYLDLGYNLYSRSYSSIIDIISKSYPILYFIFIFFRELAKIFKIATISRDLSEIIFSNFKIFKNKKKNLLMNNFIKKKDKDEDKYLNPDNITQVKKDIFIKTKNKNKNILDENDESNHSIIVKCPIYNQQLKIDYSEVNNYKNKSNQSSSFVKEQKKVVENLKIIEEIVDDDKKVNKISRKRVSGSCKINQSDLIRSNFNFKKIEEKENKVKLYSNEQLKGKKSFDKVMESNKLNDFFKVENLGVLDDKNSIDSTKFIHKEKHLYNYKYYLLGFLLRKFYISKEIKFLPKNYMLTYNFMCHVLDISSYVSLFKQFNTMKNSCIEQRMKDFIDSNQTININNSSIMKELEKKFAYDTENKNKE